MRFGGTLVCDLDGGVDGQLVVGECTKRTREPCIEGDGVGKGTVGIFPAVDFDNVSPVASPPGGSRFLSLVE